jgi:hypothetical protein
MATLRTVAPTLALVAWANGELDPEFILKPAVARGHHDPTQFFEPGSGQSASTEG